MFNQINAALVSIKDDFEKHLKKILSYSKLLTRSVYV